MLRSKYYRPIFNELGNKKKKKNYSKYLEFPFKCVLQSSFWDYIKSMIFWNLIETRHCSLVVFYDASPPTSFTRFCWLLLQLFVSCYTRASTSPAWKCTRARFSSAHVGIAFVSFYHFCSNTLVPTREHETTNRNRFFERPLRCSPGQRGRSDVYRTPAVMLHASRSTCSSTSVRRRLQYSDVTSAHATQRRYTTDTRDVIVPTRMPRRRRSMRTRHDVGTRTGRTARASASTRRWSDAPRAPEKRNFVFSFFFFFLDRLKNKILTLSSVRARTPRVGASHGAALRLCVQSVRQ